MRLRPYRRTLATWNLHVGSSSRYGVRQVARPRRIRRRLRTGVLLTLIGLMRLARAVQNDWRPLAGAVLTVAGVVFRSGSAGALMIPGMLLLVLALLTPPSPKAARSRRGELEHELGTYSTPAERSDLGAILDRYPDGDTHELRTILAAHTMAAGQDRIPGTRQ
ncbi:MAG: hypothetical protein ABSB76_29685 [Streptosporangiaceae bacterium]|jgi:hypothetical protein